MLYEFCTDETNFTCGCFYKTRSLSTFLIDSKSRVNLWYREFPYAARQGRSLRCSNHHNSSEKNLRLTFLLVRLLHEIFQRHIFPIFLMDGLEPHLHTSQPSAGSKNCYVVPKINVVFINIEAEIWCEIFPKIMKNWKIWAWNIRKLIPREAFKACILGTVGVGWEFDKIWIRIKNIRASADV